MGRSNGSLAPGNVLAGRAGGRSAGPRVGLSVVDGCCEDGGSSPAQTGSQLPPLQLRAVEGGQYEIRPPGPAEKGWPGARFVAAAVLVAEFVFPRCDVRHLSHVAEREPTFGRPIRLLVAWRHVGASCITGQITFMEDGLRLGEAAVTLQPAASLRAPSEVPAGASGPAGEPRVPDAVRGAAVSDAPLCMPSPTPWEWRRVSAPEGPPAGDASGRHSGPCDGECACEGPTSLTAWIRVGGPGGSPTLQRALLALLSEPIAALPSERDPSVGPQPAPAVLGRCITFVGEADLSQGVFATVDRVPADAGPALVMASVRDSAGMLVATVCQTAAPCGGVARQPSSPGRRPVRAPGAARQLAPA